MFGLKKTHIVHQKTNPKTWLHAEILFSHLLNKGLIPPSSPYLLKYLRPDPYQQCIPTVL